MINFGPRVALTEKIWRNLKHQAVKLNEKNIKRYFDLISHVFESKDDELYKKYILMVYRQKRKKKRKASTRFQTEEKYCLKYGRNSFVSAKY